jgi:hypothetical protein
MPRTLSVSEAETHIIELLKKSGHKMKTSDIYQISRERGVQCPDDTVKFLNKMRLEGKIQGEVSIEAKGWLWYLKK